MPPTRTPAGIPALDIEPEYRAYLWAQAIAALAAGLEEIRAMPRLSSGATRAGRRAEAALREAAELVGRARRNPLAPAGAGHGRASRTRAAEKTPGRIPLERVPAGGPKLKAAAPMYP